MKLKIHSLICLLAAGMLLASSCQTEPDLTNAPTISFKNDIQSILAGNCTMSGCHNGNGREGAFSLETYDEVVRKVTPGNSHNSELYMAVANRTANLMPPAGPLPTASIQKIYLWIEQGAKNN
jgi:hypothetical protein